MQIAKWGNSLAIRIPADVARALGLKEGDEVDVTALDDYRAELKRKLTREEVLARMKALNLKLPDGYKFNRDELYEDRDPL
jgi:antitoxin MazE